MLFSRSFDMVMMKKYSFLFVLLFIINSVVVIAETTEDLELNSLLVKVALHDGEQVSRTVAISSTSGGDFEMNVVGVPGISLKYGLTRDIGFEIVAGVATSTPTNSVTAVKLSKHLLFLEHQMTEL